MGNSDPLYSFGQVLQQQFNLGSSNVDSLNLAANGTTTRYGQLGAFATQFDQSAERSYTEEGSFRVDQFNPKPKQLDILMQDPEITVFIKKRAFASLDDNSRPDLMDQRELLLYTATKVLFQNKCNQISTYEKLSKLAQVSTDVGRLDTYLLPILFSLTDALNASPGSLTSSFGTGAAASLSGFSSIVQRVREIVTLSVDNDTTTWITNLQSSFQSSFAQGTGVIELTNVVSLSTSTSIKFNEGRFSLNISDPYELMLITTADIDQAISDATNQFYNNSFFQLGVTSLNDTISLNKQQLTAARAARGAAAISFVVQPDTFIGQRVQAIIDSIGAQIQFSGGVLTGITLDPSALQGSQQLGSQGLSPSEVSMFNDIVTQYLTQLSLQATSRNTAAAINKDPNITAVRKKLRLYYANKLIIQPMDTVNIYIGSQKKIDNKIVGGLQSAFNAGGFMQGATDLVANITDAFGLDTSYPIEKAVFIGDPSFPNWLWLIFRSWFMSEKDGAHVFAGVVEEAVSSYANGAFSVSATGTDNAAYFNYGIVNLKPSANVYNGALYDPLTPFDIKFDSVTGFQQNVTPTLLPENVELFSSAFVKYKNGPVAGALLAGQGVPSAATNYFTMDAERQQNTNVTRVFYDPDGFVYRWKEGIATLVGFGDSYDENPTDPRASPSQWDDPFAGQDIMNVLALLITGEPYNFATFYKAASSYDNYARDPVTGGDPSYSYFRSLQKNLKYRNLLYGNFVPFKLLTMDEASFAKIMSNQLNAQQFDGQLQALLQQRAALADKAAFLTAAGSGSGAANSISPIISGLDLQIQQKINNISQTLNSASQPLSVLGNDISFDSNATLSPGSSTSTTNTSDRDRLRKKIGFLTRRLSWKVRANEDVNFFVADDTYDKDYDIQAFDKVPANPDLFRSEYVTVADQVKNVSGKLELEVFCNTQGHIEVRNPKYNRMPSSVFYKMLKKNDELGIKLYPQFLEDLFVNQVQGTVSQIESIEDEIRLYCIGLSALTDAQCNIIINGMGQNSGASTITASAISAFMFLSNEQTGKIANIDQTTFSVLSNPDQLLATINQALTPINSQTQVSAFGAATRASIVQAGFPTTVSGTANSPIQFSNLAQVISSQTAQQRETMIVDRLQSNTGTTFDVSQIFGLSSNNNQPLQSVSSMDLLNITNQISSRLVQRQAAIQQAAKALKNAQETLELAQDGSGSNRSILPSMYSSNSIPQVFEHMIEDESYDDLGPNSGQRYVIKNHDIISYSISEKRPPHTAVRVNGRLGDQFIQNSQFSSDLSVGQNGNLITSAEAVDYDLWRQYGIALPQDVEAPFITDPNTQAPIYAVSMLNRARKQIISGTIEVIGNEFQQPGEVIYMENRDLLFYVESVAHNFAYGQKFTTSMAISYGHNPGEYIPTPLDVIGKMFYKNKDITAFTHKKQGNVFNQQSIGVIVGEINNLNSEPFGASDITNGTYGDANRTVLQKIFEAAGPGLAVQSSNFAPVLELRTYYNSDVSTFGSANDYATDLAEELLNYLTGKSSLDGNSQANANPNNNVQSIQSSLINILAVDCSSTNAGEFRCPSAQAFYLGRDAAQRSSQSISSTTSSGPPTQEQVDSMIYGFIVDCWIVFQNPNNPSGQ